MASSETEVAEILRTTFNWRAPGRDPVAGFGSCSLQQNVHTHTHTHTHLATPFNKLIEEGQIPDWLTTDVIILFPNPENTERPKNYRSITCLPIIYKTITSIISIRIQNYSVIKKDGLNFIRLYI
jgi:hypothetical protein